MKYYIAYGSNMNREQMASRCPDAEIVGNAVLENYTLLFAGRKQNAVATVRPKKGSSVPVLVWQISESDEESLDRYEGFPSFYEKEYVRIKVSNSYEFGMMYVMRGQHSSVLGIPSKSYFTTIADGYRASRIPLKGLEEAVEFTTKRFSDFDFSALKEKQLSGEYIKCPRCGRYMTDPMKHALSRNADIMVCDTCGMGEAIKAFNGEKEDLFNWYCMWN